MKSQITLVSPPDDVYHTAVRILLVDLDQDQTQVISESLLKISDVPNVILYVWNNDNEISWLFDKHLKSDLIVFNADSIKQEVIGFMAAQTNSCYFGTLKDLSIVNNKAIYNIEMFTDILTKLFEQL
jgi:hypothetical protein